MSKPSLQDGIDQAGSPIKLVWKAGAQGISVPVVPPEYTSWQEEAAGGKDGAVLLNLSHHMFGTFLRGRDSLKLLRRLSATDVDEFEIGQAKQMVPLTPRGDIVTDTILMRTAPEEFVLTGVPSANDWLTYHAEKSGLDVSVEQDPDSGARAPGEKRPYFRYQLQGDHAMDVMERALGAPPPKVKFFHSQEVSLAGRTVRAFRHGMLGQPGFELLGAWDDADAVMDTLLKAGEGLNLLRMGGLAYYMNGVESGWIPTPTPGIYTDPALADFRKWLPLYSFAGQMPLHGSFFSEDIEDYYVSPIELGYGRIIKSQHDYIGKEALAEKAASVQRTKVTLVYDPDDLREALGGEIDYTVRHVRDRIEVNGELVGVTMHDNYLPHHGTIMALGLVDKRFAEPGTKVDVAWGEHPGPGTPPEAHRAFPRIRATVETVPYNAYARTHYRA